MRRILVVIFVLGIGLSSAATQSDNDKTPPAGTTRVAVCNVGVVFNRYVRAIQFKTELEDLLKKPRRDAKRIVDEMAVWENQAKGDDLRAGAKEKLEDKIRKGKRDLEDLNQTITRMLGKKSEENLVTLWKEVQDGIRTYAMEHKIELVLGYGDPVEKDLLDRFANVNRKMQAMDTGSSLPLFVSPRADISQAVADLLNRRVRDSQKNSKTPPLIDF